MDTKERYLYGTLFALVAEQTEAIAKYTKGNLGWWGKGRLGARSKEIDKFLQKIVAHKIASGAFRGGSAEHVLEHVGYDLAEIEMGGLGKRVSDEQIEFVKNALGL